MKSYGIKLLFSWLKVRAFYGSSFALSVEISLRRY